MSKSKRRAQAARRMTEYLKHGSQKVFPCGRCGQPGPHFIPPCFGDIGFYSCDPPADIRNHTRDPIHNPTEEIQ